MRPGTVKGSVVILAALLSCAACTTLKSGFFAVDELLLAKDGRAFAQIVVSSNCTMVASFAAMELKCHLEKMTGARFPIVTDDMALKDKISILVGPTSKSRFDLSDFKEQEFVVDVRKGAIELIGLDDDKKGDVSVITEDHPVLEPFLRRATTYALYSFLSDTLGVKWLDPTDFGTIVPSRRTLSVKYSFKRKAPFFKYRGGTFDRDFNFTFWKDSQGAPAESEGYKKYYEFAYGNRDDSNVKLKTKLFLLRHCAFGEKAEANHSFYGWYARFWEKDDEDNDKFEEYRPEYFSKPLKEGVRPSQLCYSDPRVVNQTVKDVRDYFNGPKDNRRWGENCISLEPMDNTDFCACERCRKEYEIDRAKDSSQHSTYWFKFVNKVAREIALSHPGKKINTLAYSTHEGVPAGITLEDNVTVYFCLFNNRMPYKNVILKRQMDRLDEWAKAYPEKRFALWLYNTFPKEIYNYSGVIGVPGFFAHHAQKQYHRFKALNFSQGIYHCGMNGSIDTYLQFRWMSDPSLSADTLLDEYFSACGKASEPLKKIYNIVEERYASAVLRPAGMSQSSLECMWGNVLTREVMDKLSNLMIEAEKAVADGTELEKRRVELFRLDVWQYMLAGQRQYEESHTKEVPVWDSVEIKDAGGGIENVRWEDISPKKIKMFYSGGELYSPIELSAKFANDPFYLYLELEMPIAAARLKSNPSIAYCDDIEFYFSTGKSSDYRAYFLSPDGRIRAGDFGSAKWNVAPPKNLGRAFGAKYVSDTSESGCWRVRCSFSLSTLADAGLGREDSVFLNIASVLNPDHVGRSGSHTILISTSYAYQHDMRRVGRVKLSTKGGNNGK